MLHRHLTQPRPAALADGPGAFRQRARQPGESALAPPIVRGVVLYAGA